MNATQYDGDDWRLMRTIYSPVCSFCRNVIGGDITSRRCKAFPDGIPNSIWLGRNNHKTPYPGDKGYLFDEVRYGKKS